MCPLETLSLRVLELSCTEQVSFSLVNGWLCRILSAMHVPQHIKIETQLKAPPHVKEIGTLRHCTGLCTIVAWDLCDTHLA